jgi:hypothetical protein
MYLDDISLSRIFPTIDFSIVILNGILITFFYSVYGLLTKGTLIRFFVGFIQILVIVYFLNIGNNLFSLFFPITSFSTLVITINLNQILTLTIDYTFFTILALIILAINVLRTYLKPNEKKRDIKTIIPT